MPEQPVIGTIDIGGDIKQLTIEVAQEAVDLYDLTRATLLEIFNEPLPPAEAQRLLEATSGKEFAEMMASDPDRAAATLRAMSKGGGR